MSSRPNLTACYETLFPRIAPAAKAANEEDSAERELKKKGKKKKKKKSKDESSDKNSSSINLSSIQLLKEQDKKGAFKLLKGKDKKEKNKGKKGSSKKSESSENSSSALAESGKVVVGQILSYNEGDYEFIAQFKPTDLEVDYESSEGNGFASGGTPSEFDFAVELVDGVQDYILAYDEELLRSYEGLGEVRAFGEVAEVNNESKISSKSSKSGRRGP